MHIQTLFENKHILVINKPSGLVVHSDGKRDEPTLVDWILEHYPEIEGVGEDMVVKEKAGDDIVIARPGIVHRIDRDTSGVLVIAKTQESFLDLKKKFQNREIQKEYLALVYGWPREEKGVIDVPIGRHRKDFRMKQTAPYARGQVREAETRYETLRRFHDERKKDKQGKYMQYALLKCSPKTGRTHQIRVHLKHIHHPIVADPLYRGKRKETLGLSRTALHAHSIRLKDISGEEIVVSSPLAEDIQKAINLLIEE